MAVECRKPAQQLIKNNELLITGGVIIRAAILNVTEGWPIKSFPECPDEVVQNESTVNYARLAACPANYLPSSLLIDKKAIRKLAKQIRVIFEQNRSYVPRSRFPDRLPQNPLAPDNVN